MRISEKNAAYFFNESAESDIVVKEFGYNDFSSLKAYKLLRKGGENALHVVLRGKGTLVVDNKEYRLEEKQAFCIPKYSLCKYYPDEKDPWAYI